MENLFSPHSTTPTEATQTQPQQAISDFPTANLPHDNQASIINTFIWLLTGLSLCILCMRIYCKFLRGRGLWWDDYVLVTSWASLALASGFTTASTTFGYGKHLWDIQLGDFYALNVVSTFAGFFSVLAAVWSKTSFAITVLRLSTGWMRWVIWFIIISVNIVLGMSAILQWIRCVPVQRLFDWTVAGECWSQEAVTRYNTFSSAYSGTMDICLAIFPWKIIGGMTMNRKEKLGVLLAMSMGVFAGTASLFKVSKISSLTSFDPRSTVSLVIWGVAESAITIIAASIPILRALLRDHKASNGQQSEAELELNTIDWNFGDTNNAVDTSDTGNNTSQDSSRLGRGTRILQRIRGGFTQLRSRSTPARPDPEAAVAALPSSNGAPSWVTSPITVPSVNRNRENDTGVSVSEIVVGSTLML